MKKFICIHGHFYQPPRENPWIEDVEVQDSAHPYHDWNERITSECYAPNASSRIMDDNRKIINIVNNYSKISFNFGPTLLSWLQIHDFETYNKIIEADKLSQELFNGHGTAMAQVFNHIIMPLANREDKETQVKWGIEDFRSRFGREPEGMWLAETAVDTQTLEVLAENNIKFTVLAPGQAKAVRRLNPDSSPMGDGKWEDVSHSRVDPKRSYICKLPSGKSIALFFYDGPVSQKIAFEGLLNSGEAFAGRLLDLFDEERKDEEPQLVHIATDGETYGHHHRHGEMALSYCLHVIEGKEDVKLTCYGEYLEYFPPEYEVEIIENSSWSCIHGVERWRSNCGCNSGRPVFTQEWRAPLRGALDWLRDNIVKIYQDEGIKYLKDIWHARNEYIKVIMADNEEDTKAFLKEFSLKELSEEEEITVLRLLEMQRNALLMYTSCGWFFDEISGIETVQIMFYAERTMQLAEQVKSISLHDAFVNLLEHAPSNISEYKTGASVFRKFVSPALVDLLRVGIHFAASSLFKDYLEEDILFLYRTKTYNYKLTKAGKHKIATGQLSLKSMRTFETAHLAFAAIHFGDHNFICGTREFMGEGPFEEMQAALEAKFHEGQTSELIRFIDEHFDDRGHTLWQLFRDEQRDIVDHLLIDMENDLEMSFSRLYREHYALIHISDGMNLGIPSSFKAVIGHIINKELEGIFKNDEFDGSRIEELFNEVERWGVEVDEDSLSYLATQRVNYLAFYWKHNVFDIKQMKKMANFLNAIKERELNLNLWVAQNVYFTIGKENLLEIEQKVKNGDKNMKFWLDLFNGLSTYLKVSV